MNSFYVKLAVKKAQQSCCTHKISALGFNSKGECVAKAINKHRFNWKGGGIHAERRIMEQHRQKGIKTILICRVGNSGSILPIDPCPSCAKTAQELGIKIITVPSDY
jgi:hypothetical protein